MLQRIRIFWLWLVSEYRSANEHCAWCGRRGIESISIAYPMRLCRDCGMQAQVDAFRGYRNVDAPACAHGKTLQQECDECQGGFDGCSPQVEEVPCFDTYPAPPPKEMRDFFLMFFSQLCSYMLITMNYRAIAHGNYLWTASTDLLFAGFNFGLIKRIAKSETDAAWAGYTIGGVVGSMLGILITKHMKGF